MDTSYDEKVSMLVLMWMEAQNPTEAKLIAQVLVRINEQMRQKALIQKINKKLV